MESIVRLSFCMGESKNRMVSSASLISYKDQIFLATAAHCLYDPSSKTFAKDIYIELKHGSNKEVYNIQKIAIPRKWVEKNLLTYDYAFASIALKDKDRFQFFIPSFDFSQKGLHNSKDIISAGINFSIFRSKIKFSNARIDYSLSESENLIGMKSKSKTGASGGPWFYKNESDLIQVGVTSAKLRSYKNFIWAPIWTVEAEELLNELIKEKEDKKLILQ